VAADRNSRDWPARGPASAVADAGRVLPLSAASLRGHWGPWLGGALLALVLLGPVLGPGALLTSDLVVIDPVPVPRGVWGLGPELPRRVPLWVPIAWLAPIVSSELLVKLLMAASITVAFAGAHRLTRRLLDGRRSGTVPGGWLAAGAGVLYAASPFLLTRLAVGHLMVAVPMAALPWALPHLLQPARSVPRTFLAAAALGFGGHVGGIVALVVVTVGLCSGRGGGAGRAPGSGGAGRAPGSGGAGRAPGSGEAGRRWAALAAAVVAQLPWLVPGVVVVLLAGRAGPTDAVAFRSDLDGMAGALGLLAGHGFWQPTYQVGRAAPAAVAGAVVLVLAVAGAAQVPQRWRVPFAVLVVLGLAAAAVPALPGGPELLALLGALPGGATARESQRFAFIALVVLAPVAALGAGRLSASAARIVGDGERPGLAGAAQGAVAATALAVGVASALPAVGGVDPRLRPVELPPAWHEASSIVTAAPGPVLALPWHQYLDVDVDGRRRRALHPGPLLLGGDVLISSDPELDQPEHRERLDPREETAGVIVAGARAGRLVSGDLAGLGVRWVLVLHEVDWRQYSGIGDQDPGLRAALRTPSLDLWEVRAWSGLIDGGAQGRPVVEPLLWSVAPEATIVNRPHASGWMRGFEAAARGPGGRLALPPGSGVVWYWPALVVLAGDGLTVAGVAWAIWRLRRGNAHMM
jgi:hypothetical protein